MQKRSLMTLLLLTSLAGLTGCWKDKKKVEKETITHKKKTVGEGFSISGLKTGTDKKTKKYDKDLEAFVLDDEDEGEAVVRLDGRDDYEGYADDETSRHNFVAIYFDFDKNDIRKDQEPAVKADILAANDALNEGKIIKVEGHSDQHYLSELYNLGVSQRRAHTVAKRLAESGIDKNNIKAIGYGATRPAVNKPGEKAQENRRVEAVAMKA